MSSVTIRGETFSLDLFDIDDFARTMAAERAFLAEIDLGELLGNLSEEKLVELYSALLAYFDVVLGKGSLDRILQGKRSVLDGLDAFFDLRDAALESAFERELNVLRRNELPAKYRLDAVREPPRA